jgi:hypothetical protein
MSAANVCNEKGLISGRLLDTAAFPLASYFQNPATANLNMATNDIVNGGDCAITTLSHAAGGLNAVFLQQPLVAIDTIGLGFQNLLANPGRIESDHSMQLEVATAGTGGELLVGGAAAGSLVGSAGFISLGDTQGRTSGAAAGTITMAKNLVGAAVVANYLPITLNGVPYWIPLIASDPQTT